MSKLDNEVLVKKCYQRWNISEEDERTRVFKENMPSFLEGTDECADIIEKLINNLFYYSHEEINKNLKKLYKKINGINGFNEQYAIYSILKSESGKMNSSTEYLLEFCLINDINKYNRYADIDSIEDYYWENINTVVVVDDFCGSGDTFIKFLKKEAFRLKDKKVIYAVVHIMENSIDTIMRKASKLSIKTEIVFCCKSDKAFGKKDDSRQKFMKFSESRGFTDKKDILGYELSEALLAFYNNTPNNTLGIFRRKTRNNTPLFPRKYEKKPKFMLDKVKRQKEQRKISNYNRGVN